MRSIWRQSSVVVVACLLSSCTPLELLRAVVQAPRFEQDQTQRSEIRFLGPSTSAPAGSAAVRIWTRVSNPNDFGVTLGTLRGTLHLEGSRAATADFPLGLPLQARGETVVPLDISVNLTDVPGLGQAISRAIGRQPVGYELEGTIGVAAGRFGEPVFGPMTLLRGELR